MITIYVDESGNLGRGGDYFVFGAVVFRDNAGKHRLKRLMKKQCAYLSSTDIPLQEIKSNSLSFKDRQYILQKIVSKVDNDIYYMIAKKADIWLLRQKRDKNLIYNFFAGILITKIIQKYNDDITVIFDQRSTKVASMNSLSDYIRIKVYDNPNFHHEITVSQRDSMSDYNLQIADIISGTVYGAYTKRNAHFIKILRDRIEGAVEFPASSFKDNSLTK